MTRKENILKEIGFEVVIENETEELDKENTYVTEQTPKPGIVVSNTSKIYLKYQLKTLYKLPNQLYNVNDCKYYNCKLQNNIFLENERIWKK